MQVPISLCPLIAFPTGFSKFAMQISTTAGRGSVLAVAAAAVLAGTAGIALAAAVVLAGTGFVLAVAAAAAAAAPAAVVPAGTG